MKAQLSLEILISMLLSLLIVLLLLQSFRSAHALISKTEHILAGIAGSAGAYPSRLIG